MSLSIEPFEDMYRTWYAPVLQLCRRHLGGAPEAEGVAQDAFVRAWLSWGRFSPERPFGPWVTTIAKRLCVNEAKAAERRERRRDLLASHPPAEDDPIDRVVRRQAVADALGLLSARHRRILCLRDIEGWSYQEIARRDGITVEAVRGSLKRARAEFRRLYVAG